MDEIKEVTYTIPQVARLLRVDDYTVRHWIRDGILEAERIKEGRRTRYRIKQSTLDRYLNIAPLLPPRE
jgi:excisionase family DNA binding protein